MFKKLVLSIFLFTAIGFSQVVYTEPPFATRLDSFSVIFDASQGDGGLAGYSGSDVYAHTGVTIEGVGSWQYVGANWTDNLPHRQLTRIEGDLWRLDVGDPYEYYGVPENQDITQLSFVFKNSDQTVTGRDIGGADIFLTLPEPNQLNVVMLNPFPVTLFSDPRRSPLFLFPDSIMDISSLALLADDPLAQHSLFLNSQLVTNTMNDTLSFSFEPDSSGMNIFTVIVQDSAGTSDSTEFAVMVVPEITEQARPEGIEDGINYVSDNEVTLSLMAPYKEHVFLIGDFNDWLISEEYMLKKHTINEDNVHWWIELTDIIVGQEYAFQYLVDGGLRIADPLTHKVLHKDDGGISANTFPDLKSYPNGKTDFAVSVFQTAQTEYDWQIEDFQAPPQEELIIYELLVRDFVATHDYKTLKDTLDYLENLGINAIEIMPVNEFEDNESWGYNPSFWMALDKYYGPPEDLKAFIDECHARGIAVIMDIVLNHQYGQSPLVQLYVDYFAPAEIIMKLPNPWFNKMTPDINNKFGADFNHESPHTEYLVDRTVKHWLTEYKFDGFRFDYTKGFTNKVGDGGAYDPSRISNLKRMADYIWSINPNAYVICENWSVNSEEKELAEYGMMLWGHPNSDKDKGYYEAAMGYHDGDKSDFSWGYFGTRGWDVAHLVTKITSHDEERLMYKNITYGNSSGDYDITVLSTALQRMKAVASFYFTIPGPKLFWQFMEVGYDFSIDHNGRVGNKPIRWDYFQDPERRKLYDTFTALLKMRQENAAFRDPASLVSMTVGKAMKRITIDHDSLKVSIIGNFGVTTSEMNPTFYETGFWYDFFTGDSFDVIDMNENIVLAAGEFHIFTNKKLNSPEVDPVTSLKKISNKIPENFKLNQNFPNPFNPETVISYQLPENSRVLLKIYDVSGRVIETLVNRKQTAGKYQVTFNAQDMASGIYFYTLNAGNFTSQRKMILIK